MKYTNVIFSILGPKTLTKLLRHMSRLLGRSRPDVILALYKTLIRDRIVVGVRENALRKKMLMTKNLTLDNSVDICRSFEETSRQVQSMTLPREELHAIGKGAYNSNKNFSPQFNKPLINCRFCGGTHPVNRCPAWGKRCSVCQRRNHYAKMCNSRQRDGSRSQVYGATESHRECELRNGRHVRNMMTMSYYGLKKYQP